MCKIFDLCAELVDDAPGLNPGECDGLFQALKDMDFEEPQTSSDSVLDAGIHEGQEGDSRGGEGCIAADVEQQTCMSQGSYALMEFVGGNATQGVQGEVQQYQWQQGAAPVGPAAEQGAALPCELARNYTAQAAAPQPHPQAQHAPSQPPARKRRRSKTAEEIREQAERLRCRRRDAAARSRNRKADYVKQLEEQNKTLLRRVEELEQQLRGVQAAAINQSAQSVICNGQQYGAFTQATAQQRCAPIC